MQKMGVWGSQGALKVIGNVTIRQSAYDFLFDFIRNHASILYRFRDIAGYLSKVDDFDPPHLHSAHTCIRQGVIPVEFLGDLWHQKTRVPEVSCGVVCVILRFAVLVELRLVTDGHRHRHRSMASTADAQHRAVKTICQPNSFDFATLDYYIAFLYFQTL